MDSFDAQVIKIVNDSNEIIIKECKDEIKRLKKERNKYKKKATNSQNTINSIEEYEGEMSVEQISSYDLGLFYTELEAYTNLVMLHDLKINRLKMNIKESKKILKNLRK
jgi:hypothetical protein